MTDSSHFLKDRAVNFLEMVAVGQVRQAYDEYVGPGFRHHNPFFKSDAGSLMAAMADNAAQFPDTQLEVQRALQDGELVAVHSKLRQTPQARSVAVVHLFRFEAGRIVELWDIGQAEPENPANEYGMF